MNEYANLQTMINNPYFLHLPVMNYSFGSCAASMDVCCDDGRYRPKSCPNCGAPATKAKCEYCGSILWR